MTWLGEHGSSVMKVARAYTLTSEECQDLAQEILLQAWRSLPNFERKANAVTWFYRVALQTAMNWHRKDRRRRLRQQPLLEVQALATEGVDGAEQAQQRETVERLYDAIHRLPQTDAALVLLYLDELSYQEMADVLGISESNVGVKLNRAKKALNELMKGESHEPDNYQQAWRAHSTRMRVTVDADSLLNAVQLDQQFIRATIIFDYVSEIGTSLLMLPVWIYMGVTMALPWTWYLMVPVCIWSIGFTLVVRARQKRKPSEPGGQLLRSVKESLALVEREIWWTRNVSWWFHLPTAIAMLAFLAHVAWLDTRGWWETLGPTLGPMLLVVVLYGATYFLNQRSLRTQYEPRRQELLTLLASLRDETTNEVGGEYPILLSAKRVECSRMFVVSLCFVALVLFFIACMLLAIGLIASRHDHPEKSPFAAVRWQQSQAEVKVGEHWQKLVSLDELPASEIVAFSKRTYGNQWRKRFEEDLVELLTRMGHPPQDTVKLVVQSLTSSETQVLENIPMTEANRRTIKAAAKWRAIP